LHQVRKEGLASWTGNLSGTLLLNIIVDFQDFSG
jgi:hypothetical protein